jgi:hypothetical protein
MKNPHDDNPNETMQLDIEGLAGVQLLDEPVPSSRVVPPPLPPGSGLPPPSAHPSGAPPRRSVAPSVPVAAPKSRTPLYAAVFVGMVVVAVGGGLTIGSALRGDPPATSASAPPSATTAVAPARAPSASAASAASAAEPGVITLPTIELADIDANAK